MEKPCLNPGESGTIECIVSYLKARGVFDQFRHECLADVDTKASYQNLSQRVDGYVSKFLTSETWNPDKNKNELRNKLRREIDQSGMLSVGVDHIVEQVIHPKISHVFIPRIREVVEQYFGLREIPDENEGKASSKKREANAGEETPAKEKSATESSDANKTVLPVVDPIADILSLCDSSKQKKNIFTSSTAKSEVKTSDGMKPEKHASSIEIKREPQEPMDTSSHREPKTTSETREHIKIKKELKSPIADISVEFHRKTEMKSPGFSSSEDNSCSFSSTLNSDTDVKSEKIKGKSLDKVKPKIKSLSSNKESPHKSPSEMRKVKQEVVKSSSDKNALITKNSKTNVLPEKSFTPGKAFKESSSKSSKTNFSPKVPDSSFKKNLTSKSNKKEESTMVKKIVAEKSDKMRDKEQKTESSESSDQKSKTGSPYTSTYDSSQESDEDEMSTDTSSVKKQLFSRSSSKDSNEKASKKDGHDGSNHKSLPGSSKVKEAHGPDKKVKILEDKMFKKSPEKTKTLEVSKSLSRSVRTVSTCSSGSVSDSSKEVFFSAESDNVDESSSTSQSDMDKKRNLQQRSLCKTKSESPPPSPPSPSSDALVIDDTMSSDEAPNRYSNSDDSDCEDSDDSSSPPYEKHLGGMDSAEDEVDDASQTNEISASEIFMPSSSDDEFMFSPTPSKPELHIDSDVTVSSVHTSDLSSFEDELSFSSQEDDNENKPIAKKSRKRKITLKEAEHVLQSESVSYEVHSREIKALPETNDEESVDEVSSEQSGSDISSDEELPSLMESNRGSRRERKLNPKYASSEYTSIFNSKRSKLFHESSNPNDNSHQNSNESPHKTKSPDQPKKVSPTGHSRANEIKSKSNAEGMNVGKSLLPTSKHNKVVEVINEGETNSCTTMSTESKESGSDCQYTITLKIKKAFKPEKLNHHSSDHEADSSPSKNSDSSLNLKYKLNSLKSTFPNDVTNENKPFIERKKSQPSVDTEQKRKRHHSDFKEDSFISKSLKKDGYESENLSKNGEILKKKR